MPRSNPPKARMTPAMKGLLQAASVARGEKAQEAIQGLMADFCKTPTARLPKAG